MRNLKSYHHHPSYKFCIQVPQNHSEAMTLDERNGDYKWLKEETTELDQLDEYKVFQDLGIRETPPAVHKKITAHFFMM